MATQGMAQDTAANIGFTGINKRLGSDRRSGGERRTLTLDFEGPERRVMENRRDDSDRRLRRAGRRRRR